MIGWLFGRSRSARVARDRRARHPGRSAVLAVRLPHVVSHRTAGPRLPFIVCNDDWATPATNVPFLLRRYQPAGAATQESKGENYAHDLTARDALPQGIAYGVRQRVGQVGPSGVAVLWRKDLLVAIGTLVDAPSHLGHGWQFLVDGPDLEPRGVAWQDLRTRRSLTSWSPFRFRLASAHRPPAPRDRHLWPRFDDHLAAWAARSPLPVLIGMDCNQPGGPAPLVGRRTPHGPLRWHGNGIDGVLTNLPEHLVQLPVRELAERTSDHHPQVITLTPHRKASR